MAFSIIIQLIAFNVHISVLHASYLLSNVYHVREGTELIGVPITNVCNLFIFIISLLDAKKDFMMTALQIVLFAHINA